MGGGCLRAVATFHVAEVVRPSANKVTFRLKEAPASGKGERNRESYESSESFLHSQDSPDSRSFLIAVTLFHDSPVLGLPALQSPWALPPTLAEGKSLSNDVAVDLGYVVLDGNLGIEYAMRDRQSSSCRFI
jgi:hypothetical protein